MEPILDQLRERLLQAFLFLLGYMRSRAGVSHWVWEKHAEEFLREDIYRLFINLVPSCPMVEVSKAENCVRNGMRVLDQSKKNPIDDPLVKQYVSTLRRHMLTLDDKISHPRRAVNFRSMLGASDDDYETISEELDMKFSSPTHPNPHPPPPPPKKNGVLDCLILDPKWSHWGNIILA